jgi:hypothetical protein
MELGNHLRCSFENERNFQGLLDLDLFVTCGWVAGAVICYAPARQLIRQLQEEFSNPDGNFVEKFQTFRSLP